MENVIGCALKSPIVVLSLMGPHAGESTSEIFFRKLEDVRKCGRTLWAMNSWKATPQQVQRCRPGYLYIINDPPRRSQLSSGELHRDAGVPTADGTAAREYHTGDRRTGPWKPMWPGLSPVTTNPRYLRGENGRALVLKSLIDLRRAPRPIQMADFADISGDLPVPLKTGQGFSTICAARRDMRGHADVWLKERVIIAVAEFDDPYAVWLR